MNGEDLAQAPRNVLRRLIAQAAAEGMHVKTGIEAEFFLLTPMAARYQMNTTVPKSPVMTNKR